MTGGGGSSLPSISRPCSRSGGGGSIYDWDANASLVDYTACFRSIMKGQSGSAVSPRKSADLLTSDTFLAAMQSLEDHQLSSPFITSARGPGLTVGLPTRPKTSITTSLITRELIDTSSDFDMSDDISVASQISSLSATSTTVLPSLVEKRFQIPIQQNMLFGSSTIPMAMSYSAYYADAGSFEAELDALGSVRPGADEELDEVSDDGEEGGEKSENEEGVVDQCGEGFGFGLEYDDGD